MTLARALLLCGLVAPLVYFGGLVMGHLANPGFNSLAQPPSDLGVATMEGAALFNAGLLATGALAAGAGLGALLALWRSHRILGAIVALSLTSFAAAMLKAGFYPLPDPRHYAPLMTLGGLIAAPAGAFALEGGARRALLAAAALSFAIIAAMFGLLGPLVGAQNLGAWIRALALVTFSANAFFCWRLWARPSHV